MSIDTKGIPNSREKKQCMISFVTTSYSYNRNLAFSNKKEGNIYVAHHI